MKKIQEKDVRLKQEKSYYRKDSEDPPLIWIKEIGYDNTYGFGISKEQLFFVDESGNTSFNATDEAIMDFINRKQHDIESITLYLVNDRNNNTHEWKINISKVDDL